MNPSSGRSTNVQASLIESPDAPKESDLCPPSKLWRIPDPYDCSLYHDCYHGTDLVSHCPAQLQYNPEKQSCDYIQNVQCRIIFYSLMMSLSK